MSNKTTLDRLIYLYQSIADLTASKCAGKGAFACRVPHSCCSSAYCEMTIEFAREERGVVLERTSHPTLPLMGAQGCTADPYLRPLCTLHVCSLGMERCGTLKETESYFKMREEVNELEFELKDQTP